MKIISLYSLIFLVGSIDLGEGARILGLFPTASVSHQVVYRALTLELNKRGHELVIVTPDPIKDPTLKNYTEIDISYLYNKNNHYSMNFVERRNEMSVMQFLNLIYSVTNRQQDLIYQNSEIRKMYIEGSNVTFDGVLVEQLMWHALYPLLAKFNAPIIGIVSLNLNLRSHYAIGNPIMPSHQSNWELGRASVINPSFWQRVKNFIDTWEYMYYYQYNFLPFQQEIARKYLGNDIPSIEDIEKNVSLILTNQLLPISYARPRLPKVIEIGGLHLSKKPQRLPKDLKEFLDNATQGFIYMSLGTNVKTNMLSNEQISMFLKVFSKLPYKVLWKFDADELSGKPDNLLISKWVPQQAVLSHPNIKLFIYQGGLQSTEEAVYNAVPLVGVPIFADQDYQVNKMVSVGVARRVEITSLTVEELDDAIRDVINDKRYKQKMLELSSLVKDRPYDLLENAVWWIEFVIRHKGAPHLQSNIADDPWYRRSEMDVVAFLSVSACSLVILSLAISYCLLSYVLRLYISSGSKTKKKLH